ALATAGGLRAPRHDLQPAVRRDLARLQRSVSPPGVPGGPTRVGCAVPPGGVGRRVPDVAESQGGLRPRTRGTDAGRGAGARASRSPGSGTLSPARDAVLRPRTGTVAPGRSGTSLSVRGAEPPTPDAACERRGRVGRGCTAGCRGRAVRPMPQDRRRRRRRPPPPAGCAAP